MIVDYGAATGLLLREISQRASATVIGVDISQFALGEITRRGGFALDSRMYPSANINPDTVISLDVFEHMTDEEIRAALKNKPKNLIVRIPVKQFEDDTAFFLDCSNKDVTHINCKTHDGWIVFFERLGYRFDRDFGESGLIYSSNGVFTGVLHRK
ncbi:MAG: hypothetical protein HHAS10_04670 [Candidatus Altimarinota bacterium]